MTTTNRNRKLDFSDYLPTPEEAAQEAAENELMAEQQEAQEYADRQARYSDAAAGRRVDRHSPTNMRPEDYSFVGVIYYGEQDWAADISDPAAVDAMHGAKVWAGHRHCQCDHCGSRYAYGSVFEHVSGDIISVGHICAAAEFGLTNEARAQKLLRKRAEGRRKADKSKAAAEKFLAEHEGLEDALSIDHHISRDMLSRLRQWGSLSPRQIEFAHKLHREATERATKKVEEAAAASPFPSTEGRVTIEGVIVSTRWQENHFGYGGGGCTKMLLKADDGNKFWGTMPSSLDAGKGDRVRLDAKLTRSDDDEHFGFFSRPTKAAMVEEAAG